MTESAESTQLPARNAPEALDAPEAARTPESHGAPTASGSAAPQASCPSEPSSSSELTGPTSGAAVAAAAEAVQSEGPSLSQALADLRAALEAAGTPKAGPELMIALDVDGTILHLDTSLSRRVARAIEAHRAAGTHLVLASGRGIYATLVAADAIGIASGPAVCSNGAITIELGEGPERIEIPRDGHGSDSANAGSAGDSEGAGNSDGAEASVAEMPYRLRKVLTFDPAPSLRSLREALPEARIAVERTGEPRLMTEPFPPGELIGPYEVVDFEELLVDTATRVTLRGVGMEVAAMHEAVRAAGMHGVEYNIGWSAWLDVSPPGVSKAAALEELRRELGIPLTSCVAAGDGSNDLEMVEWAGVGVAMGGAPEALKAVADAVTTTVAEDGLAELLEMLL